ncbi:MAG: MerR family transcriptional regulator [Oscillospiraceae bacterium]|nr:MerR family transcriptional regulator [Oscillospiraceae bacterium]
MELQPIGQVSKQYEISIHTLRYYEQIGLIQSTRNDDNAYRFYDEAAVKQLHSIVLLRKLRISLKQIKEILDNQNTAATVEILERNISELDDEITSLSTIKSILTRFAEELRIKTDMVLQFDLLNDTAVLSIADSTSFSKNYIKEKISMENLNKANETLNKLKDSDVRIIYVPPMTVAAAQDSMDAPSVYMVEKFVRETRLLKIKPDARGMMKADNFSNEDPKSEHRVTAKESEFWVSVPDDMEVKAPLIKKTFEGGLYAAFLLKNSFEDLRFLAEWINASEKYELADGPWFWEILNYYNWMPNYEEDAKREDVQSDLLLPIKKIAG